MKEHKTFIWIVAAILGLIVSSCTSDEPTTEINDEVVEAYQNGGITKCFKISSSDHFKRKDVNSKWEKLTNDGIAGIYPACEMIVFTKGQVWTEVRLHPSMKKVYSTLSSVWQMYKHKTGCNEILYTATTFQFDRSKKILTIDDIQYNVEKMTENELRINDDVMNDSHYKISYLYKTHSLSASYLDRIKTFDTKKDAYYYILNVAKECFGDKIEWDKVYNNGSKEVIDLNELERMLEEELS